MSDVPNMPFGRFKGTPVNKVPKWYLGWLKDNVPLYGELKEAVEQALGVIRVDVPGPTVEEQIAAICEQTRKRNET